MIILMYFFNQIFYSGYEITDDAYHYTLSTISQTVATLVGLFAIFSIYIMQELKRKQENELKTFLKFVYIILGYIIYTGLITIIYSLCFLPLFQYVENPLKVIFIATILSTLVLSFVMIFLFFTYEVSENF